MTEEENHIHIVEGISLLARLVRVGYSVMVVILGIAVGGAIWVTRVDARLTMIEKTLSGLAEVVKRERPPEWLLKDIHEMRVEDKRLQRQIDRIESILPGVHKLPLPHYIEEDE